MLLRRKINKKSLLIIFLLDNSNRRQSIQVFILNKSKYHIFFYLNDCCHGVQYSSYYRFCFKDYYNGVTYKSSSYILNFKSKM